MCGIVGILSHSDVTERLLEGLSCLEYRGYDSAGVALMDEDGQIDLRRSVGKLSALRGVLEKAPMAGRLGIGHTRWATHGAPTEVNAHPHRTRNVTLVHNGIIENYADLRSELEASGLRFASDTDTEVAARLLSGASCPPRKRLRRPSAASLSASAAATPLRSCSRAIPISCLQPASAAPSPSDMERARRMAARRCSSARMPWRLRLSRRECPTIEDGDWAINRRDRVLIFDAAGREVTRDVVQVPASTWSVDKGPYRHFMLKEIHEQPESLARLTSRLIDTHTRSLKPLLPELDFSALDRITLVACGTAHYACHVAKPWFQELAGIAKEIDIASEYRYRRRVHSERELFIAVSQSGETADTLAAIKDFGGSVAARLAVVNVATSSIAREADFVLDIEAGPEIGVASTKAFTGQMLALLALALKAGQEWGALSREEIAALTDDILSLPRILRETLSLEATVTEVAAELASATDALVLGRGVNYPIALEAALKLTEISYIHTDGYAAGELKHGPIALFDRETPVIVFEGQHPLREKTLSNAAEVAARGARVWRVGQTGEPEIRLPDCGEISSAFAYAAVAQLLAYHVALQKGTDVDQPRNLAKSVTVE